MKRFRDLNTGLLVLAPIFAIISIGHAISVWGRVDTLAILLSTAYTVLFSLFQLAIFRKQSRGKIPKRLLWISLFYSLLILIIYPGLMNILISPAMNLFAQLEAVLGVIFGAAGFANSVKGLK